MPLQREQPDWVRAAEELVRRVRRLLDDHGAAFEDALARSMGSLNEARAEVDQIEALVHVLEIELWRRDKPRVSVGGRVAVLLMGGLGLVAGQTLDNVANDMYDALTGAQHQAKVVEQCVSIDVEGDVVFTLDESELDSDAALGEPQAAEHGAAAEQEVEASPPRDRREYDPFAAAPQSSGRSYPRNYPRRYEAAVDDTGNDDPG